MNSMKLGLEDLIAIRELEKITQSLKGKLVEVECGGDRQIRLTLRKRKYDFYLWFKFSFNAQRSKITEWILIRNNGDLTSSEIEEPGKVKKFLKAD